jgi:hypothetical protein
MYTSAYKFLSEHFPIRFLLATVIDILSTCWTLFIIIIIIILTTTGLMPGGSVTKIGRTCKKLTYIARKQNIQLTKKQHISLKPP